MPSDVRKASGLPASSILNFGLRPSLGRSPKFVEPVDGSAERFRTSGGIAEFRWLNFLGKASPIGLTARNLDLLRCVVDSASFANAAIF